MTFTKPGIGDNTDLRLYNPEPADVDVSVVLGRKSMTERHIYSGYSPKQFMYNMTYNGILHNMLHCSTQMEIPIYAPDQFSDPDSLYFPFSASNPAWDIYYWTITTDIDPTYETRPFGSRNVRFAKIYGEATIESDYLISEALPDKTQMLFSFYFRKIQSIDVPRPEVGYITITIKDSLNSAILGMSTYNIADNNLYLFDQVLYTHFQYDTTKMASSRVIVTISVSGQTNERPCYTIGGPQITPLLFVETNLDTDNTLYSFGNNLYIAPYYSPIYNNVIDIVDNNYDTTSPNTQLKPYIGGIQSPRLDAFINECNESNARPTISSQQQVIPIINAQNTGNGPSNGISPVIPPDMISKKQYGSDINSFAYMYFDNIIKGPGVHILDLLSSHFIPNFQNVWDRCYVSNGKYYLKIDGTATEIDIDSDYTFVDLAYESEGNQASYRIQTIDDLDHKIYVERWVKISGEDIYKADRETKFTIYLFGDYNNIQPPSTDNYNATSLLSAWEDLASYKITIGEGETDNNKNIVLCSNDAKRLWIGIHIKTKFHAALAGYDVAAFDKKEVEFDGLESRPLFYFGKGDGHDTSANTSYSIAPIFPNDITLYDIGFIKKRFKTDNYATQTPVCISNGETYKWELLGLDFAAAVPWYQIPTIIFVTKTIGKKTIIDVSASSGFTLDTDIAFTLTSKTKQAHVNWPNYESAGEYSPYRSGINEIFNEHDANIIRQTWADSYIDGINPFTITDLRLHEGYVLDRFNITDNNDQLYLTGGDGDYQAGPPERFFQYCTEAIWPTIAGYVSGYPPTFADPDDVEIYSMTRLPATHPDYGRPRVVLPSLSNNYVLTIRSDYSTTWCPDISVGYASLYGFANYADYVGSPDDYEGDDYYGLITDNYSKYIPGSGVVKHLLQHAGMEYTSNWCLAAKIKTTILNGSKLFEHTVSPAEVLRFIIDDELTDNWFNGIIDPQIGTTVSWLDADFNDKISTILPHCNVMVVDVE